MRPTKKKQAKIKRLTKSEAQDIAKWMSQVYYSTCEARCEWGEWVVVMKMRRKG